MGSDRTAEFMQNARIHQESAQHALTVKDIDHWCLAAVVNVDSLRLVAAVEAVLKLADEWEADSFIVDPEIALREAITAALTGEEAGDGG
jgi:hypothetical protein